MDATALWHRVVLKCDHHWVYMHEWNNADSPHKATGLARICSKCLAEEIGLSYDYDIRTSAFYWAYKREKAALLGVALPADDSSSEEMREALKQTEQV